MSFTLQGEGDAVRFNAGLVTGNFFQVMGLSPVIGRLLDRRRRRGRACRRSWC